MPVQEALAFLLFAFVAAGTPGPSNVLVMAAGARAGLLGGLRCLAGVVAGMALLMGLAVLGLGSVLQAVPSGLLVLKAGSSLLLLRLAWQISGAPPPGDADDSGAVGLREAFLFQWMNPKSWVVGASAAATFAAAPGQAPYFRAAAIAGLFAVAAAAGCGIWLVSGAMLRQWLQAPQRARLFNRSMGALLAASVVLLWI